MALLIAIIAGDFKDISFRALAVRSFFLLTLGDLNGISLYCDGATVSFFLSVLFSPMSLSFLFHSGFFIGLLDDLCLIRRRAASLGLWRCGFCFFGLIITSIEAHL